MSRVRWGRNISELNEGLASLHDSLQRESFAAAKVRLSVIGFSDTAFTYLEPADLRFLQGMPVLTAQSLTSYAAAFDQLALPDQCRHSQSEGTGVHRASAGGVFLDRRVCPTDMRIGVWPDRIC